MEPGTALISALAAKSSDAGVEVAKDEAKGFLKQLFGPSAEVIGEDLALRHRERLFNNLVEVLARAKRKLTSTGVSPHEVPLKIIHPLLEAAALEENTDLREMWANLLAGAATEGATPFAASYIDIIKQLSVEEARFLNLLHITLRAEMKEYDALSPEDRKRHPTQRLGRFDELKSLVFQAAEVNITEENHDFVHALAMSTLENMCRLGILREPWFGQDSYRIGAFGLIFLQACYKPDKAEA
jgi:hypothetical protein